MPSSYASNFDVKTMLVICLAVLLLAIIIGVIIFICVAYTHKNLPGFGSGSTCESTPDCSPGLVCEQRSCRAIENTSCRSNTDCIGNLYCNAGTCQATCEPKYTKNKKKTTTLHRPPKKVSFGTIGEDRPEPEPKMDSPVVAPPVATLPAATLPAATPEPPFVTVSALDRFAMGSPSGLARPHADYQGNDLLETFGQNIVEVASPVSIPFEKHGNVYDLHDKQLLPSILGVDVLSFTSYARGILALAAYKDKRLCTFLYDTVEGTLVPIVDNFENDVVQLVSNENTLYGLTSGGELRQVAIDTALTGAHLKARRLTPLRWQVIVLSKKEDLHSLSMSQDGSLWAQGSKRGFLLVRGKEVESFELKPGERRFLGKNALDMRTLAEHEYSLTFANEQWHTVTREDYGRGLLAYVRTRDGIMKCQRA